ncbi:molybdopterin-dependent oxidoreductase [Mycobacterium xenopi]|uniref:Molybdopterin oxidoreductase n=2 Tax=Mycobacterium xenopi TaxID=1789 RepID=A0AAD1M1B3_MYCXE|nr:molybdopterin-dependent oxidoreductase [Mycobacterium xenopi]MDA3641668.1 molybdopterin-dependent oxidoreductase [Mycobacterium xenopi]MDA3660162.1 molybdopterin-dependent oxidoreductase [Mycobacterium xenopi]MDA3663894.1 molybdopterin-dependent oxidoreductase [Mycobacterium xenopi]ORX13036.1 molybdopterin oxidoreductase [Mycobacterium xenopi]SPX92682.1 molybdopterin oxidoreductase Fe4S4 subunit [Mycobacterium xenopi]
MGAPDQTTPQQWHPSACILCECNCGIEIQLDGRRLARIRGDKRHPSSAGYTCEKPLRLDHYQNGRHRLTTPLRRRADGAYEQVDWATAIQEIAARLTQVRDTYGGDKIFFYGGGGQGNHLGGIYNRALQAALGVRYFSNALAQEKTGEMWVDGKLYGGHTKGDFEHAEVVVFVGKNPWQSHSFPRARPTLREIAKDPARTMIVLDPRRSETAAMADIHLQVRPGTDAWCLAAMLAVIVQEDLVDHTFLADHTTGTEPARAALAEVPIDTYAQRCGVPLELIRAAARRIASAESAAVYEDLGVQQGPHSTLVSYLDKLLWILTGNFGKPGAMFVHSTFAAIAGASAGGSGGARVRRTPVTGARIISGLVPCNSIAEEILTDHPDRFRAMWIDSANPAHSLTDSDSFRRALAALDLVVVVDVAFTETARHADYVLPAASQFEKWEMTFFNTEFPCNTVQLRPPVLDPLPGTLPEPEIYARLLRALGGVDPQLIADLTAAARTDRREFTTAFFAAASADRALMGLAPYLLYETLGATMPEYRRGTAAVWGLAQLCAMAYPDAVRRAGHVDGNALFDAIVNTPWGVTFTADSWDDVWTYVKRPDRRFTVDIPELVEQLRQLRTDEPGWGSEEFPMVLSAGERRAFTANTIYRDPTWRRRDAAGALRMSPQDADRLGLADGAPARVITAAGTAQAVVEITDMMQPGHVSLPNGLGVDHPDHGRVGVAPNDLTSLGWRDAFAGTPWHKHVPARVEAV